MNPEIKIFVNLLESIRRNRVVDRYSLVPVFVQKCSEILLTKTTCSIVDCLELARVGEGCLTLNNGTVLRGGVDLIIAASTFLINLKSWPSSVATTFLTGPVDWLLKFPSERQEGIVRVEAVVARAWDELGASRSMPVTFVYLLQQLLSPPPDQQRYRCSGLLSNFSSTTHLGCATHLSRMFHDCTSEELECLVGNASLWDVSDISFHWLDLIFQEISVNHRYDVLIKSIPLAVKHTGNQLVAMYSKGTLTKNSVIAFLKLYRRFLVCHPQKIVIESVEKELLLLLSLITTRHTSVCRSRLPLGGDDQIVSGVVHFVQSLFYAFPDANIPTLRRQWLDLLPLLTKDRRLLSEQSQLYYIRQSSWVTHSNLNEVRGLANLGNTCYMNSVLQILFYTDEYRGAILAVPLASLTNTEKRWALLLTATKALFVNMLLTNRPSLQKPVEIFRGTIRSEFKRSTQEDASEFYKLFLDDLSTHCNVKEISQIFEGSGMSHISCKCGAKSSASIAFREISLPLNEQETSVRLDSLMKQYMLPETLGDGYVCQECHQHGLATKQTEIEYSPQILTISLKRFYFDIAGNTAGKLRMPVEFPREILVGGCRYHLFGVILHHGKSLNCGHYTALACHSSDATKQGQVWHHLNDDVVSRVDATSQIWTDCLRDGYIFFFTKGGGGTPLPKMLCPNIMFEQVRVDNVKYMLELNQQSIT